MTPPVVLVLRSTDRFSDLLWESGCQVLNLEVTKSEPLDDLTDLKRSIAQIDRYDGLFLTSPVAATVFVKELKSLDGSFTGKVYVLGERTKKVFEDAGINVKCPAGVNTAGELVAAYGDAEFSNKSLLFIRGDRSMRTIPQLINSLGSVEEVVVYRTLEYPPDQDTADEMRKRLRGGEIDWICFFAPSSVDGFLKVFYLKELIGIKTAAIGQTTGQRLKEVGLHLDFVSRCANASDFAIGLVEFIKSNE